MKKLFILGLLVFGLVLYSSAQSVGVGSTAFTPQSTLHVYNAAGGNLFQLSSSTAAATGFQINMNSGVNFSLINRQNGYMSFYTNNTEYMRLINTGYLGIGNTAPYYLVHIRQTGSTPITLLNIHVSGTTTNQAGIIRFTNTTNNDGTDQYSSYIAGIRTSAGGTQALAFGTSPTNAAPVERMRIDGNGNVGIGTTTPSYKLHVIGRLKTDGINETSDRRLKKNIEPITGSLDKIQQLQGVTYEWKDPEREAGTQLGLIAQDVEEVIPYIVNTDNEGYKSLQYSVIVALLIEGVKDQQSEIEELKYQMSEMQKQIDALKTLVSTSIDTEEDTGSSD
ncbi:MAG: tail fiber domain-containing protein [Bacteroidales bacterium]|nr:tail fiber domain-containing protein [Bacteroidales bacterium]